MSYLNTPRLTFSGQFQADPSTVNNDPTHFNGTTFIPAYQDYSGPNNDPLNGWWNPDGTGNWRLIGCKITSVTYQDGTVCRDSAIDPVVGAMVMDTDQRTAAKLVDLDSEQQMVSEIWGMVVRIVSAEGITLLKGSYEPAAFTNIWFSRSTDLSMDSAAGAVYQSVVKDLEWHLAGFNSRYLTELRAASPNQLSINFNVDRYNGNNQSPQFTLGRLAGAMGPSLSNEPDHFVLGRQLFPNPMPQSLPQNQPQTFNYATAVINTRLNQLVIDMGNALQFINGGKVNPVGTLQVSVNTGTAAAPVYQPLGVLPYDDEDWYMGTSGICTIDLSEGNNLSLAASNPLAVFSITSSQADVFSLQTQSALVLNECVDYVRADKFVFRLDTYPTNETCNVTFYATSLGVPKSGKIVVVQDDTANLLAPPPDNQVANPPAPPTGTPPIPYFAKLTKTNGQAVLAATDTNGMTTLSFPASPPGNPRGYINGQIYGLSYKLQEQSFASDCNQSNFISLLIFDSGPVIKGSVAWSAIQPIMTQYANLYPLMSKGIFNLADQHVVKHNAKLLYTVFSKNIEDPNYMPATRDLSGYNKALILNYLQGVINA